MNNIIDQVKTVAEDIKEAILPEGTPVVADEVTPEEVIETPIAEAETPVEPVVEAETVNPDAKLPWKNEAEDGRVVEFKSECGECEGGLVPGSRGFERCTNCGGTGLN